MLTEEQCKVIRRTAERIESEPRVHDQTVWYRGPVPNVHSGDLMAAVRGTRPWADIAIDVDDMLKCGTTACLAGHAVCAAIELGVEVPAESLSVSDAAQELLGLDEANRCELFSSHAGRFSLLGRLNRAAEKGEW